jgi:hypothetical protein
MQHSKLLELKNQYSLVNLREKTYNQSDKRNNICEFHKGVTAKWHKIVTFPFISLRAAAAASSVVYSIKAYPFDLFDIRSIIILTI